MGEMTRVAGRSAQDIVIRPRDDLRFGYQLSLDHEHALPLRTAMLDKDGRKVSQILFTNLRIGEFADPVGAEPLPSRKIAHPSVWEAKARAHLMQAPAWGFVDIPAGFMLNVHRRQPYPASDTYSEHFIFSDGLATVSVYVEPSGPNSINGTADAGPMNVYGRVLGDHHVTAVGEVPSATVRFFSEAIRSVAHAK
jgi:sigma-E factor negative regulatory protein RseB